MGWRDGLTRMHPGALNLLKASPYHCSFRNSASFRIDLLAIVAELLPGLVQVSWRLIAVVLADRETLNGQSSHLGWNPSVF